MYLNLKFVQGCPIISKIASSDDVFLRKEFMTDNGQEGCQKALSLNEGKLENFRTISCSGFVFPLRDIL